MHQPSKLNGSPLDLPEQHDWLTEMMVRCPNMRLVPDGQGIGSHIATALQKKFGTRRVVIMLPGSKPKGLKPQDKTEMITETKRALESEELKLMLDREQFQQFRRTKKAPGGVFVQSGATKRDHFDRFWSTCYAQYGIALSKHFDSAYRRHGLAIVSGGTSRFREGTTDVA
jgi:phage FluMu gp28-like protein